MLFAPTQTSPGWAFTWRKNRQLRQSVRHGRHRTGCGQQHRRGPCAQPPGRIGKAIEGRSFSCAEQVVYSSEATSVAEGSVFELSWQPPSPARSSPSLGMTNSAASKAPNAALRRASYSRHRICQPSAGPAAPPPHQYKKNLFRAPPTFLERESRNIRLV